MAKRKNLYIFIGVIIIAVLGFVVGVAIFNKVVRQRIIPSRFEFQKGMSYVAWTKHGYHNVSSIKSMEELVSLGVEWVALVTTWYQDRVDSTEVYPLDEKSPSDRDLTFAIKKLHESDIRIMLKPHLDLIGSEGKWRGDIGFSTLDEWEKWFKSYGEFILRYARLAQEENVELFCIGTELTNASLSQPDLWRVLIKEVKEVYKGQLTYAANWHEEFEGIEFWDNLDYAGIDAYFPLSSSPTPTKNELKEAWKSWLEVIRDWQAYIDKPVIFPEVGYKSSEGAAKEPWQHNPAGSADLQLQVDCYEALLETFWEEQWFYGVYWWYWGVNPKMGGEANRGFIPQNKPARGVIEEWYKGLVPHKNY